MRAVEGGKHDLGPANGRQNRNQQSCRDRGRQKPAVHGADLRPCCGSASVTPVVRRDTWAREHFAGELATAGRSIGRGGEVFSPRSMTGGAPIEKLRRSRPRSLTGG